MLNTTRNITTEILLKLKLKRRTKGKIHWNNATTILVAAIIIIMLIVWNARGILGKALTDQDKSNVAHWTEVFLKTYACYNALDSEFN